MRFFATAALLGLLTATTASAATYRIDRTPTTGPDNVTCGASTCLRFYIDSDTVPGETSMIQLRPQNQSAYYEQACTYSTGTTTQGSYTWVCDVNPASLSANFDNTTVQYGLFTLNQSSSPYGYTGFIGSYQSNSAGLPVELVSFSGLGTASGARLAWTTASETNNSGFYVEQQSGDGWNTVSSLVAGRGTTTERSDYAFDVNGLTAGSYTFRLRQVDTDGSVRYSPNTTVEVGVDGTARLTLLGQRAVRVETNDAQAMTVRVVDLLGRVVTMQTVSVDGTAVVSLPSLAAGAYVVRVDGDRFAGSKTLIVR